MARAYFRLKLILDGTKFVAVLVPLVARILAA
jgi:hypothetical protein